MGCEGQELSDWHPKLSGVPLTTGGSVITRIPLPPHTYHTPPPLESAFTELFLKIYENDSQTCIPLCSSSVSPTASNFQLLTSHYQLNIILDLEINHFDSYIAMLNTWRASYTYSFPAPSPLDLDWILEFVFLIST